MRHRRRTDASSSSEARSSDIVGSAVFARGLEPVEHGVECAGEVAHLCGVLGPGYPLGAEFAVGDRGGARLDPTQWTQTGSHQPPRTRQRGSDCSGAADEQHREQLPSRLVHIVQRLTNDERPTITNRIHSQPNLVTVGGLHRLSPQVGPDVVGVDDVFFATGLGGRRAEQFVAVAIDDRDEQAGRDQRDRLPRIGIRFGQLLDRCVRAAGACRRPVGSAIG